MLLAVGFEAVEITVGIPPQAASTISTRDALRALLPTPLRKLVAASPVQPHGPLLSCFRPRASIRRENNAPKPGSVGLGG
jgi:hypothetical protein